MSGDPYMCTIGCKTCDYVPEGVRFYKKEYALALIFHKQLIEEDTGREVRARLDDDHNLFPDFFAQHQNHHLALIDHEGIHEPSIDDLPVTAVVYDRSSQN